ncbi:MAG: DUF2807 domain-containing protein [Bacteroidetes bacterium]|nr:DUF2807 domain-containing protein [Bacteroidota bacterium]
MQTLFTYFFILTVLFFISCNKENRCDCFKSAGEISMQSRNISPFNEILLNDNINLYITQDSVFSLTVEAGTNLQKLIKTEVVDNCLYLKNDNKCNWVRSFKNKINVYLKCKEIRFLKYFNSSGNIYSTDTLRSKHFELEIRSSTGDVNCTINADSSWFDIYSGPAMIKVNGKSKVNFVYLEGTGFADLTNLITDNNFIDNKSSNNCFVNVQKELNVHIGFIGDVYYTGSPYVINSNISGSGKLIKL